MRTWLETLTHGVAPGGVLCYGRQDVHTSVAFGKTETLRPGQAREVTDDTVYDVASITKAIVTSLVMVLIDRKEMTLDDPAARWLPDMRHGAKAEVTIRQLLGHTSGYPWHIEFFHRLRAGDRLWANSGREALRWMALETVLRYPPGTVAEYSDLGFILLGWIVELATGARLDALAAEVVFEPLGMSSARFVDLEDEHRLLLENVAPTEDCPFRGLVVGEVHDDNCHAGGGIQGHAGVFATAPDIARFGRAIIEAWHGDTSRVLSPKIVRTFATTAPVANTSRRLGFDSPSLEPGVSHVGDRWPRTGIGHAGFTGCSLWLAPAERIYCVLLTNRVHPTRHNTGIKAVRRAVHDKVWDQTRGRR